VMTVAAPIALLVVATVQAEVITVTAHIALLAEAMAHQVVQTVMETMPHLMVQQVAMIREVMARRVMAPQVATAQESTADWTLSQKLENEPWCQTRPWQ
jgi:hypothetical protein